MLPTKPSRNSERPGGSGAGNIVKGMAQDGLRATVIQRGFIVGVNPDKWTMSVQTQYGKRQMFECPIPSLYAHRNRGEGIHYMPEVGADIWLCFPSEDARPFPIAFMPPAGAEGSAKGGRPLLTPGSYSLMTRDGNGVKIHRGGLVEIESTPLCKMLFLPREDAIVTFAQEWRLETPIARMHIYAGAEHELPNDKVLGRFFAQFKTAVDEKHHSVDLSIGSDIVGHDLGGALSGLVQLDVYASGDVEKESDRELTARLYVESSGNVRLQIADGKTFEVTSINGTAKKIVVHDPFLADLQSALTEIASGLAAFGIPTPQTSAMLAKLATVTPYVAAYTKSE